jgi:ATP-binding cassette subfamily F protein 3
MLGLILPQSGRVDRVRQATFALYSQHHLDAMDLTTTPLQHMQQRFSEARVQELRNHLGAFGVADICHRPLHVCSGGQRTRVVLATLTYMQPHVLILDEPTNNLDMESIAALESMLAEAACAVVVVSHNRSFLQSTVKELYQLEQGVLQRLEDLKGYTCKLQQQAEQMLGADKYLS